MQPIPPATEAIRAALRQGGLVDITTTGRTSGQPRRIEIAYGRRLAIIAAIALAIGAVLPWYVIGGKAGEMTATTYHAFDGRVYISGRPNAARRRAWLANLEAQPNFTFHLKRGVTADLPAVAREITDPNERRAVLAKVARAWGVADVEPMVAHSPLVEVTFPGLTAAP